MTLFGFTDFENGPSSSSVPSVNHGRRHAAAFDSYPLTECSIIHVGTIDTISITDDTIGVILNDSDMLMSPLEEHRTRAIKSMTNYRNCNKTRKCL